MDQMVNVEWMLMIIVVILMEKARYSDEKQWIFREKVRIFYQK